MPSSRAEVPYVAAGAVLILVAVGIAIFLSRIEFETSHSSRLVEAGDAYRAAIANLRRILDYSGREAMHESADHPFGNDLRYRTGELVDTYLSRDMSGNFTYASCTVLAERVGEIDLAEIPMHVERRIPVDHATYYIASSPFNLSIRCGDLSSSRIVNVSSAIRSRYPLLQNLTLEFERRMNGEFAKDFAALSMLKVWSRGYAQYLGAPITDVFGENGNEDVAEVLNAAILMDEKLLFNSTDRNALLDTLSEILNIKMPELSLPLSPWVLCAGEKIRVNGICYSPDGSGECGLCNSEWVMDNISSIISSVYSVDLRVEVKTLSSSVELQKCPSGYSSAAGEWKVASAQLISSGNTALIDEEYEARFVRPRTCYRCESECSEFEMEDHKIERLRIRGWIERISPYVTSNDVMDPFRGRKFDGHWDPNLEGIEDECRNKFHSSLKELIEKGGGLLRVHSNPPPWVEEECMNDVEEVASRLSEGEVRISGLNPFDAVDKARNELLIRISRLSDPAPQTFESAGAKAIHWCKKWFLNEMRERVEELSYDSVELISSGARMIGGEISADFLRDALKLLNQSFELVNNPLNLTSTGYEFGWNESVPISVDHEPDYLGVDWDERWEMYPAEIMSSSIPAPIGPVRNGGVAVLPPPKPWLFTFNVWVVHVKGRFGSFTLADEQHDPWFGEQRYSRFNGTNNSRIEFEFSVAIPIIVPPGPNGVGDLRGSPIEMSEGYRNETGAA